MGEKKSKVLGEDKYSHSALSFLIIAIAIAIHGSSFLFLRFLYILPQKAQKNSDYTQKYLIDHYKEKRKQLALFMNMCKIFKL